MSKGKPEIPLSVMFHYGLISKTFSKILGIILLFCKNQSYLSGNGFLTVKLMVSY